MSESVTLAVVRGTFALLLFGSVVTWVFVLVKARQRWITRARDRRFLAAAGTPLDLGAVKTAAGVGGPAWRVAQAGLASLAERGDVGAQRGDDSTARQELERALSAQIHAERRADEGGLAVLASIGTTAPFVGLFGTVLGIINALRAIGHSGSASIEVVAAPIGEALVATAIGIAVAVPAVLAYNFFLRRAKIHVADLEQLASAFVGASVVAAGFRGGPLLAERSSRGERAGAATAAVAFEGPREASV
jgi:biopolymer transport protein ExbB